MANYEEPDPLDPEGDTTQAEPDYFARGAWMRQSGVGGASTRGAAPSVLNALANPPTGMVTAAADVRTHSVVTDSDKSRYYAGTQTP